MENGWITISQSLKEFHKLFIIKYFLVLKPKLLLNVILEELKERMNKCFLSLGL